MSAANAVTSPESERAADILARAREDLRSARFEAAETSLVELLDQPVDEFHETEALYMLAVARRYGKDFSGALAALYKLIELNPEHGRAYQERGHTCLAMNELEEATKAFATAVDVNPGLVASWKTLANLHHGAGQERKARFAESQVDYLQSLGPELLGVLDLMHEGKLFKAEQLCRHYLQRNKHDVEGMRLLAELGVRLKVLDDAEFLLESCVELAPDNVRARADYLKVLNRKAKFEQAFDQAKKLVEADPENPAFQLSMASALTGLGRFDDGIEKYRQALERTANKAGVQVLLGHAYKAIGKLDDAIASYHEACRLEPAYGDAFWSLANTKTYRFSDDEIAHMREYEANRSMKADDRVHLCFALGKACEDRSEFETSFACYERGNAMKKRRSGYDPDKTTELVDAQIETCTRELFEQRGDLGFDSRDPIFIVGLPRAGSTLLEQILASHSEVDGTMELHNILGLAQRLRGRSAEQTSNYPEILHELGDSYFRRFGEKFIDDTRIYRGEAPYFIDKMPNNFLHIGLIRLILPNAKIIDARRHPMACCFSGFKQLFGEGQAFTYGLEAVGRYYRDYVRLMDHWDDVLQGFVLRVQHEDVVDDLETQVRRMLDFCELPFEDACLEFYKSDRNVRTPSSEQVRQPIYKSGLEYWRNYEPWLGPMKEALGEDVRRRFDIQ